MHNQNTPGWLSRAANELAEVGSLYSTIVAEGLVAHHTDLADPSVALQRVLDGIPDPVRKLSLGQLRMLEGLAEARITNMWTDFEHLSAMPDLDDQYWRAGWGDLCQRRDGHEVVAAVLRSYAHDDRDNRYTYAYDAEVRTWLYAMARVPHIRDPWLQSVARFDPTCWWGAGSGRQY